MTRLERAIGYVLDDEGGYVNDAADPGGETNFGISRRAYPMLPIAYLTRADAMTIYARDYWGPAGCGQLPPALAYVVLDTAVNLGVSRAVRLLQRALGVAQDGVIGPLTVDAAQQQDQDETTAKLLAERGLAYTAMEHFPRYGRGWLTRCFRVQGRAHSTDWEA